MLAMMSGSTLAAIRPIIAGDLSKRCRRPQSAIGIRSWIEESIERMVWRATRICEMALDFETNRAHQRKRVAVLDYARPHSIVEYHPSTLEPILDRKSTRLNSSHVKISY